MFFLLIIFLFQYLYINCVLNNNNPNILKTTYNYKLKDDDTNKPPILIFGKLFNIVCNLLSSSVSQQINTTALFGIIIDFINELNILSNVLI